MKSELLLLTNPSNGDPEEDIFLATSLNDRFDITISHPLDCKDKEDEADLILIRNIWPVTEYKKDWNAIRKRFIEKGLKTYNPLSGKGDMEGKHYLITLAKKGYPVIPTASSAEEANMLKSTAYYITKPIHGGSGVGIKKICRGKLPKQDFRTHIVQPYIDFECEISFYYIDNEFQYALYAPDKKKRWDLQPYIPSPEELDFAKMFVEWNMLPYGVQRIDAVKTRNGKLLLMEIEDFCPYLSLLEINERLRNHFLNRFSQSLHNCRS